MRIRFFCLLMVIISCVKAQDKIYFLDGTSQVCKVHTVNSEFIGIVDAGGAALEVSRELVLLVEYRNGFVEVFNLPSADAVYHPEETQHLKKKEDLKPSAFKKSYASLNTLALTNSDIAAFYEYMPSNLPFGFGLMGAYNFNTRSTLQNIFISVLHNGKKNYDIGATINYYPRLSLEKKTQTFIGILVKHTDFSFDFVKTDTVPGPLGNSQVLTYTKTRASQLAVMGTVGKHIRLNENFFIRAMASFGAFKLNGAYRDQYNYQKNKLQPASSTTFHLPKIYLGINAGFNF